MCLLIVASRIVAGAPLIVAANRDELYQRPAVPLTVLRDRQPRILGGRDKLAGGTWLAVSEHGLVAGLTNQPSAGRDPTRRSRGELPLAFAAYPDAATAVAQVCARLDPADYNPCWLLVGDRHRLYSIGVTGGHQPDVTELPPGSYVLENAPLRQDSAKQRYIAGRIAPALAGPAAQVETALAAVLADHQPTGGPRPAGAGGPAQPAEVSAACVHTARYGTRSAMIVSVPADGPPRLSVADGPPCTAPLVDGSSQWASPGAGVAPGGRG